MVRALVGGIVGGHLVGLVAGRRVGRRGTVVVPHDEAGRVGDLGVRPGGLVSGVGEGRRDHEECCYCSEKSRLSHLVPRWLRPG